MQTPAEQYAQKRVSAAEASASIADTSNLILGMGVAMPPAFMAALAERARNRERLTALNVYYMHASEAAAETILKPDLQPVLKLHSLFMSSFDRAFEQQGLKAGQTWVHFVPCLFHQASRLLSERFSPDCFVTTVSPMDRSGHFSLGTNADYGADLVRSAKRIIVEVNPNMPRTFGQSLVHISQIDMLIEHTAPLMTIRAHQPSDIDRLISEQIVADIPDRATIQMGVGGVPAAVLGALQGHVDLGLHSELLSPPMADLIERGVITGSAKKVMPHKHVFTLALGDEKLFSFMNDNPSIVGYPASWVNNPAVIRKNPDMISVNSAIEIDLTGQVNSESINGLQFSGTGGQLDFVRGAYLAPGGKSFIALHSTAKKDTISRIVPQLTNAITTDTRMDIHFVVTEYGKVDLKGLSLNQRASAIIGLAHPKFRDDLTAAAGKLGLR